MQKVTTEILDWLKENAYALKEDDYWFLPDFPDGETPDRLEIPINKNSWKKLEAMKRGYVNTG